MISEQPQLKKLFYGVPKETFKKERSIFQHKKAGNFVYLLVSGMAKVLSHHPKKVFFEDYFEAGELINGYIGFHEHQRKLSAVAMLSPTVIKKLPVDTFRQAMRSNLLLCEEIMAQIGESMRRTQDRLYRMSLLSAPQRVYHFLVRQTQKTGKPVGLEYLIQPVVLHRELANIIGVGRQTATTILNDLRQKKIIDFNRRYMIIRDLEKLQRMAEIAG